MENEEKVALGQPVVDQKAPTPSGPPGSYSTVAARALIALCGVALVLSVVAGLPGQRRQAPEDALLDGIRWREPGFDRSRYGDPIRGAHVVIWPAPGFLTSKESQQLLLLAEQGLADVEKYLHVRLGDAYGAEAKLHLFVRDGPFISHTLGAYRQREDPRPVIFLSFVGERRAPYLHEIVHILSPDYGALWLREGLAVHLGNRFSRWPVFMRLGDGLVEINTASTDDLARKHLPTAVGRRAWALVGGVGTPDFERNGDLRTLFYIQSGSFVAFLDRELGTSTLMAIYRAADVPGQLLGRTGRSVDDWKAAWLTAIGGRARTSLPPRPTSPMGCCAAGS